VLRGPRFDRALLTLDQANIHVADQPAGVDRLCVIHQVTRLIEASVILSTPKHSCAHRFARTEARNQRGAKTHATLQTVVVEPSTAVGANPV
jgi:hypothetical protein